MFDLILDLKESVFTDPRYLPTNSNLRKLISLVAMLYLNWKPGSKRISEYYVYCSKVVFEIMDFKLFFPSQ